MSNLTLTLGPRKNDWSGEGQTDRKTDRRKERKKAMHNEPTVHMHRCAKNHELKKAAFLFSQDCKASMFQQKLEKLCGFSSEPTTVACEKLDPVFLE